jgi:hypothetical protein
LCRAGMQLSRNGEASFPRRRPWGPRRPAGRPPIAIWLGWSSQTVSRDRRLASSPRKKTRAPGGPADRVERSSPALRNPAAPPPSQTPERACRQTGVPPPRTGQCEMKPSWVGPASGDAAGPRGVSSRICGCQRAGLVEMSASLRAVLRGVPAGASRCPPVAILADPSGSAGARPAVDTETIRSQARFPIADVVLTTVLPNGVAPPPAGVWHRPGHSSIVSPTVRRIGYTPSR